RQRLGPPRIGFDLFEQRSTLRLLARFALASVLVSNSRCLILWVTLTNELANVLANNFLARSPLQGHMDHLQTVISTQSIHAAVKAFDTAPKAYRLTMDSRRVRSVAKQTTFVRAAAV